MGKTFGEEILGGGACTDLEAGVGHQIRPSGSAGKQGYPDGGNYITMDNFLQIIYFPFRKKEWKLLQDLATWSYTAEDFASHGGRSLPMTITVPTPRNQ